MAISSTLSVVSFRERVFLRYATLLTKRMMQDVDGSVVDAAIIAANDGDEKFASTEKYYAVRNTVKHLFYGPSKPVFFVVHRFGTKLIPGAVSAEKSSSLITLLHWVLENVEPSNMSETLLGSDYPLWYIYNDNDAFVRVCRIIEEGFSNLQLK